VGWAVQGVLPRGETDLSSIRALTRTLKTGASQKDTLTRTLKTGASQILATADRAGTLSLMHFPCPEPEAPRRSAQGHCSYPSGLVFARGDSCLISTGGPDNAVLQWRHITEGEHGGSAADTLHARAAPRVPLEDPEAEEKWQEARQQRALQWALNEGLRQAGEAVEQVKWHRQDQLLGPTRWKPDRAVSDRCIMPPDEVLVLEHVYAMRGLDCTSTAAFIRTAQDMKVQAWKGGVLYFAGGLAVQHDTVQNLQALRSVGMKNVTAQAVSQDQ
ncbi:hypothetical protein T484DRAFT_1813367, partial [Baffinella frigidus]